MKTLMGCCLLGLICVGGNAQAIDLSQNLVEVFRVELQNRMDSLGLPDSSFPVVRYDGQLDANARQQGDTVWLGNVQQAFANQEDCLSLLYHERHHWLNEGEGKYPLARDSLGKIVQWDTGEWYHYLPDSLEVARDLAQFQRVGMSAYGELSPELESLHLNRLRRDLSIARQLLFVYAPSNLARDELEAYHAQLEGEQFGLYQLSHEARREIAIRMRQLTGTLARRLEYERQHSLNPDGSEKNK